MSDNIDISIWDYVIMRYFFISNQENEKENERSSGVENTIDEMKSSMDANYINYMKPYNLLKKILEEQDKVNEENIYNHLQNIACIILFIHTPIIIQYLDINIESVIDTAEKTYEPKIDYYNNDDKLYNFILLISNNIIQNNISIMIEIIYLYIDMIHEYTYIENTHEIIARIEDSNIVKLQEVLIHLITQNEIKLGPYLLTLMRDEIIPATDVERNLLIQEQEQEQEQEQLQEQEKTRYAQMQSYYKTKPHRKNIKEHSSHIFSKLKNSLRNKTRTRTQKIQSTINVRRKNLGTKKYVRFNGGKKNIYPKNKYSKKKYKYLRN